MTAPLPREVRQKKLLVMTDAHLCEEMKKYDPTFEKSSGFIARTIRERILSIEYPVPATPPQDSAIVGGFDSP